MLYLLAYALGGKVRLPDLGAHSGVGAAFARDRAGDSRLSVRYRYMRHAVVVGAATTTPTRSSSPSS
jgi:hypothetical protein